MWNLSWVKSTGFKKTHNPVDNDDIPRLGKWITGLVSCKMDWKSVQSTNVLTVCKIYSSSSSWIIPPSPSCLFLPLTADLSHTSPPISCCDECVGHWKAPLRTHTHTHYIISEVKNTVTQYLEFPLGLLVFPPNPQVHPWLQPHDSPRTGKAEWRHVIHYWRRLRRV